MKGRMKINSHISRRKNWRRGGSVVSASGVGPEGREFEPWPVHPHCVLRQNTQLSQCLSPPRCINGNQQIALGKPDKMLGGNLQWTSIPSWRSTNTPSRFILQKLDISAGLMGLLACPISIGGRLYLYQQEKSAFQNSYAHGYM